MKRVLLVIALGVSVTANAVLVNGWLHRLRAAGAPAGPAPVAATTATNATKPIDPETWTALDAAGEPADFIARLRAKGYPPALIRAIVRAQLRERFADRWKAIADAIAAQPYYRGQTWMIDPKISALQRALNRDTNDLLRQLLGPSFNDASEADRANLRRRFGDLAPEKIDALQQISSDYNEMMAEVRDAARSGYGTILLPDDRAKLALLEKEMHADVAQVLSADELDAYDLRTSRTSSTLRSSLAPLEPSEQEFLALYKIQKSIDDQYPSPENLSVDQRRERADALKQLAPQIEAALGPDRYAEYQQKTDPNWQQANRFVQQYDLPATATDQLFAIQKDITDRAQAVRKNTSSFDQLSTQLASLEQEANARLTAVLGERVLAGYTNSYGYWVRNLHPPAPPPAGGK